MPEVMTAWSESAARRWCSVLAKTLSVQHIQPDGAPYLDRYFLAGWNPTTKRPGPSVFLHHFVASDPDVQVHSHPWVWSASLILTGGYREQRCGADGVMTDREYKPCDVNVLKADDKHRIDLLGDDCWTLFLAGEFEKPWAFFPHCV